LAQELRAITHEALKAADDEDDVMDRAPNFGLFFGQLRRLLCDNASPEDRLVSPTGPPTLAAASPPVSPTSESTSTTHSISLTSKPKKRPNSLIISPSNPKPKKSRPTSEVPHNVLHTPDQPTVPKNPAHSGDSIESVDEENTKQMIRTFIHTTLSHLRKDFRRISWALYAQNCRLDVSGFL